MNDRKRVSRRTFIRDATLWTGAAALSGCRSAEDSVTAQGDSPTEARAGEARALPTRAFGRTGVRVPLLGMGTAAAGKHSRLEDTVALFHEAIDLGVNYMDAAPEFAGYGHAQNALGEVLKTRRDEVFLVTKCWEPKAENARALLERNLEELQTDHADLVYAHSVGDDKMDPELVMGSGGVMEFLQKAKNEGLTRFCGITGHSRPGRFLDIIERFEIDAMMCAVNFVDRHTYGFETKVFPEAAKKGIALVAMKILGGEKVPTPRSMCPPRFHDLALRYALGLPDLSLAVVGMVRREELHQNLERVRSYEPLTAEERQALRETGNRMATGWGPHFGPVT